MKMAAMESYLSVPKETGFLEETRFLIHIF